MEEAQVISSTVDDFVVSTINLSAPHIPPAQEQHDLLLPTLFQQPGVALQIGIGYGALVYALEELGYAVHGVDNDLSMWFEAQSKVSAPSKAFIVAEDIHSVPVNPGRYDLIIADFSGAFRDQTLFDLKMFKRLSQMLNDTGIMSFNIGVVPDMAMACIRAADATFPYVTIIPGTQVLIASKHMVELDPDRMLRQEPDWLCSTASLYGEQDLPG